MRYRAYSLTTTLLKAIAVGGVLAAAIMAPNAVAAFKPFLEKEDWRSVREAKRRRIREAVRRLRERRLVSLAVHGNQEYLEITSHGKRTLRHFDFDTLILSHQDKWDGKWRIVFFDIPEQKRRARQTLQGKLRALGFYPLQRSVFVYPYPCQDEVDFLIKFLEIDRQVAYCETDSLWGVEEKLRRHFALL